MNNALSQVTFSLILSLALFTVAAQAQTTAFTYQGKLHNSSAPVTGNYDFEFRLYDAASGGTLLGTQTKLNIPVSDGVFTVGLDFGSQFTGAARFVEIAIRTAGSVGGYQQMLPRQSITSTPYSIRSLSAANADNLSGVAANQYVQTTDSRLSDSRQPLAGSPNYIQNTTVQQASSNFNISGSGTAGGFLTGGFVNSTTKYYLGFNPILSVGNNPSNIFVGFDAGKHSSGTSSNSFFGSEAGTNNTSGLSNSFFGTRAGYNNLSGINNVFIGVQSGWNNTGGSNNTFIGHLSDGEFVINNINNATAIGNRAKVTQSNSLVLGSINGVNGSTADTNVGIGTTAPLTRLDVRGDLFLGLTSTPNVSFVNSLFVNNDGGDASNFFRLDGSANNLYIVSSSGAGASAGAGIVFRTATAGGGEVDRFGIYPDGTVAINVLGTAGGTQLCRNASLVISSCSSSSLRYKTNIKPFNYGLNLVKKLKPITFNWKQGNTLDLGLGAEDVEKVEPLLVNYNSKGEVEGVKYDRIGVVLLNAVKEQQMQIEGQEQTIKIQQTKIEEQNKQITRQQQQIKQQEERDKQQQQQIDALIKLICQQNPQAEVCKKENK